MAKKYIVLVEEEDDNWGCCGCLVLLGIVWFILDRFGISPAEAIGWLNSQVQSLVSA